MGLKFLNANGQGETSKAVNAIEFAIQNKTRSGIVRVINASWGCQPISCGSCSEDGALRDQIGNANNANMIFVASAGNCGTNNNTVNVYPANTNTPNVVAVAATDNRDALAGFSNYGSSKVHLGAPGVGILSTFLNNSYALFDGTSMAAPHVAGAGLLIRSGCPFNTGALRQTILNNVDAVPSLSGKTITGGRLNLDRAIDSCTTGTSGSTSYAYVQYRVCPPFPSWPDSGFVSLWVDGIEHTTTFNQNDTPRTIADRLASLITYHYGSTTTATVSNVSSSCSGRYNARITLTARAKGPLTNYPYYLNLVDQGPPGCYPCPYFKVIPTAVFHFSGGAN
jgi:subtilisin family serine protease